MKLVHAGLVLMAVAGLATGCGSSSGSPPSSRAPAGATTDALRAPVYDQLSPSTSGSTVVRPPGTGDLSAPPSAARGTRASVGPWALSLRSGNGQYLLIGTNTHGCYSLWRLRVEVNSTNVVITPRLRSPAIPRTTCPSTSIGRLWLIDLGSPLGGRSLLHPKVTEKNPRDLTTIRHD